MKKKLSVITIVIFSLFQMSISKTLAQSPDTKELYRPAIHFTPHTGWMNDPNGMVYYNGVYHLFFQFYPNDTHWGPMHWGHATSKDLLHWQQQPIALYPDSLGYIFSGSAVIDEHNTSGFSKDGKTPMVAIFTQHDPILEKKGAINFQNQSIAYSLDEGKTWTKYAGNPVIKNPGIADFRDPKVSWYEAGKKWVMTLATKDHITFYSSENLKEWRKESEFGKEAGAHGGVWECPDLFPLEYEGKKIWILTVSINPGAPNGGSATQYFIGQFDGNTFTAFDNTTRWIDFGRDDYAGVTWSNTGKRKIFLGWMSNWDYANQVPTVAWRSAMTVPRELHLKKDGNSYYIASMPVKELKNFEKKKAVLKNFSGKSLDISQKLGLLSAPCKVDLTISNKESFSLVFANTIGDQVVMGYDNNKNSFYVDRTKSGKINFSDKFTGVAFAPRIMKNDEIKLTLIIDHASLEMFADDGVTVMTEIFFPNQPMNRLLFEAQQETDIKDVVLTGL
ncbi:MAG: glycoside hydrolase family 32 protein [Bacteroidota bacterium]|nr:glycoside hydrolase family 32 protein [Bacteroidota bacterium]